MGQAPSSILEATEGGRRHSEVNDTVRLLMDRAKDVSDAFEKKLHDTSDSQLLPIRRIMFTRREVYIITEVDTEAISRVVEDATRIFSSGKSHDCA